MGKNKKNKAFTLVELMVVIAILAILATVSIIGYKSYIKRERVNSTITEATQAREIIISKIVANKEGKITIPFDGGSAVLTYVSGELNVTTIPYEMEFIGTFDENIRHVFPELLNLPGLFTVKGNDIFYHYNRNYIGESSLADIGFDVIVNVRTLDSVVIEDGYEGGNPYDSSVTITLDQFDINLTVGGESKTIGFNVSPPETPYHWDSANPAIATITQTGTVTPVGVGKTTVYITAGGQMKVVTVTVAPEGRDPVAVPAQRGRLIYDLSDAKQIPEWINFKYTSAGVTADSINPDKLTIISTDGKVKLTITQQSRPNTGAGEEPYVALFELTDKEHTCWADNFSTTDKTIYWRINKVSIPIPYQSIRLEFDDFKDLYPTFGNFSPTNLGSGRGKVSKQYSVGATNGIIEITDASYNNGLIGSLLSRTNKPGPYSTTFTIVEEKQAYYIWEDGDINPSKAITWVISKKTVHTPKFKPGVSADYDYIPNTMVGPGANISIDQINTLFDFDEEFCKIIDARSADGLIQANYVDTFKVKFSIDIDVDIRDILRELGGGFKVEDFYEWEKGTLIDKDGNAYIEWRVNAAEIPTPWIEHNTFEYDSSITNRALDTLNSTYKTNYSGCFKVHVFKYESSGYKEVSAAKDVGTYQLSFELTDSNVRWQGHDKSDRTFPLDSTFTITPQMTDFNIQFDDTKAHKYDGTEHPVTISEFKNATNIMIDEEATKQHKGNLSATNVGDNYVVYVKPTGNYIWRDTNNADPRPVTWKILKGTVEIPVIESGNTHTYVFDTSSHSPISNLTNVKKNLSKVTVDGDIEATHKGRYSFTISIDSKNVEWVDASGKRLGNSNPVSASYTITEKILSTPTINSAYRSLFDNATSKYIIPATGSTINPFSEWLNNNKDFVDATGISGSDKKDYTATFTLKNEYASKGDITWDPSVTDPVSIKWNITKKQLSVSTPNGTLIEYKDGNKRLSNFFTVTGGTLNTDYTVTIKKQGSSTDYYSKDISSAGDYTATFTLKGSAAEWSDVTGQTKTITFNVRYFVDPPENPQSTEYSTSFGSNGYKPYSGTNGNKGYTINYGNTKAKTVGDYTATCSLNYKDSCVWSTTKNNEDLELKYSITKTNIEIAPSYSYTSTGEKTITITGAKSINITNIKGTGTYFNNPQASGNTIKVKINKQDGSNGNSHSLTFDITATGTDNYKDITEPQQITVTIEKDNGCVTGDTLITLADLSQKRIDELNNDDKLLAMNNFTGKLEPTDIAYIVSHDDCDKLYKVVRLEFEDSKYVEIINEHVFYCVDDGKYVTISETNYKDYINKTFIENSCGEIKQVKLINAYEDEKMTRAYEVVTYKNINAITNDVISVSAYLDKVLNITDFDDNYRYNPITLSNDIRDYGLFDYSYFKDLVPEYAFELYNAKYLKIPMSKGTLTIDELNSLIDIYDNNVYINETFD